MKFARIWLLILLPAGISSCHAAPTEHTPEAQLRIELSLPAREAINNGVMLQFACDYAALKSFGLLTYYSKQHHHQFVIQRHALSNRYVVRRDELETPRMFKSISEATSYISAQSLRLLEFYADQQQAPHLRLTLNKYALPGPMRLNAFIASSWNVDSGWVQL